VERKRNLGVRRLGFELKVIKIVADLTSKKKLLSRTLLVTVNCRKRLPWAKSEKNKLHLPSQKNADQSQNPLTFLNTFIGQNGETEVES